MATLLLSAAGAAIGGSFGGSVAGMATGVIGKAVGATLGAVIDQRLTGAGSETVETGRAERFKVMGAGEGECLPRVFGRVRVAGQIIWSSRFLEDVDTTRVGGKGGAGAQKVKEYSYSISLAVALCEGAVVRVGRVWADGQPLDLAEITWRLHLGDEEQVPDPLIAAIEGDEEAPAYRGVAYVVFENLDLTPFGNRIPQFNFEVMRRASVSAGARHPAEDVRAVALVPGTGEYALATTPVHYGRGKGRSEFANVNNDRGMPDLVASLEQMRADLPAARALSLVVSWFGDDLRCGSCTIQPAVEQVEADGRPMPWVVSGVGRSAAKQVSRMEDRPAFGGTPADASVIEAIRHMATSGLSVMFYPFILMDLQAGNGLPDPWGNGAEQPRAPWRGRITLGVAPGRPGSSDKSVAAGAEVAAFFGAARPSDFAVEGGAVVYRGPAEWSYRRFILHYAHLCVLAGGVDAFCIGSEMRGLTQIRDAADAYPAVRELCALAADVRTVLGPQTKIGYAADWSEYFGHQPGDGSGDVLFHLDPLWAHPAIDFVGIDNYMPLSDWRDGSGHADAAAGSIYNLDYLRGNVAGGEGFDWYYASEEARLRQERTPIADGAFGESWVFRYKDIRSWWSRPHHDRVGGVRAAHTTAWEPRSKPIWFTELGCPAVDKGTNQPNVFYDPKSAESFFPYHSSEARDDYIQQRYLQAIYSYWASSGNNPESNRYVGRMVDTSRAFVWAWDARPWPDFPDRLETWADGGNYDRGHWINGRLGMPSLGEVVAEISQRAGAGETDVSALNGTVTGYQIGSVESARQSLQPLMLVYAFDSYTLETKVAFAEKDGQVRATLALDDLALAPSAPTLALTRVAQTESPGRVALGYLRGDADYQPGVAEAVSPERSEPDASQSSVPVVLTDQQAGAIAERWLSETSVARDMAEFALPPSSLAITSGDVVSLARDGAADLYRVDRVEEAGRRSFTCVRIEPALYRASVYAPARVARRHVQVPRPVYAEFLDLPLMSGTEVPHAPYIAVTQTPWIGPVAVYSATSDHGYALNQRILRPGVLGETVSPMPAASAGMWWRGEVGVRLASGALRSSNEQGILNGANAAAVRHAEGQWEVIQFEEASLVGRNEYALRGLLRGQAGTDGIMQADIPAGADFVLLDSGVVQLDLPASARGLVRHYRVGPSSRRYSDASFLHEVRRFAGVGLRPYRPAHLRVTRVSNGDVEISWVRRTRIDGDSWEGAEAPIGEDREVYNILLVSDGRTVREAWPSAPRFIYDQSMQVADGNLATINLAVAQVSDRFGPGPYARLSVRLAT
ncbi:glycoside hydrolase TIM-barrel-like domain-containing protein [Amaricoccus sp.]|uniref:baseplate multidomain protein megatron n=1 Tax=Amaricoccus sp. TaxID=1872485 RepID=UPI001B40EEE4|nr:glycoside hydrolase TIM-barrel-like domain-containing protein [Amaricoccus sp.]MBP7002260.1 glycoside hydrolase TIM-barrel-like domain-containing protein [Amaricoccus sp.]